ncbi:MAG TPA: hypothetical protein VF796_24795 [Humisphaera sp.]
MTAVLPDVLFKTKRGLCPACGAPLKLDRADATTVCGFCGQRAVLERRLRKIEPEVVGAPLRLYFDDASAAAGRATSAAWTRSKQYREGLVGSAACPGCGDQLEYRDDAAAITCRTCGTDCRLERRLWAPPPDPETEVVRPQHPEAHRYVKDDGRDPLTEHLIWRIVHARDPDKRLVLARKFEAWSYTNPTTARLLPTLIAGIKDAEHATQRFACDAIGKLLCEGKPELRNAAVRGCERFLFDTACPRPVVFELGLGDGVCLKPLLDAAEWAVRQGDFEYACACLWGVDMIFQRNFKDHEIMGQIILYRMLYLSGPVLAFALLLAQRQVTSTGFHYRPETLLHFMDDAAVERPAIVPELDKAFYCGHPASEGEFDHMLAVYRSLKTDAARSAALRHWIRIPDEASDDWHRKFLAFALPIWDGGGPLKEAAAECLEAVVSRTCMRSQAVHDLVRDRGRSLPVEVQRAYLMGNPKTPYLLLDGLPYWNSRPEPGLSKEMAEVRQQWKDGLNRAVDAWTAIRERATERLNEVRGLDVPLFDGVTDGPPPPEMEEALRKEREREERSRPRRRPAADRPAADEQDDETPQPDNGWDELKAAQLENYRQVLEQMRAMRVQMQAYGPQAVAAIDQQIEQLMVMCPELRAM